MLWIVLLLWVVAGGVGDGLVADILFVHVFFISFDVFCDHLLLLLLCIDMPSFRAVKVRVGKGPVSSWRETNPGMLSVNGINDLWD